MYISLLIQHLLPSICSKYIPVNYTLQFLQTLFNKINSNCLILCFFGAHVEIPNASIKCSWYAKKKDEKTDSFYRYIRILMGKNIGECLTMR